MSEENSGTRINNENDNISLRDGYKTTFEENLTYGSLGDAKTDFVPISLEAALSEYKSYMHAVHGMIWCIGERVLWNRYKQPGDVLMQMRCDGLVGFPGGLMDRDFDEPPVDCLNREMAEEINLDLNKYKFSQLDYFVSHINHKKKLITHFYVHQVSLQELQEIECSTLKADDWGYETFGTIRVPLYAMDDGYRGLPVFLAGNFAGNAREQLLQGLVKCCLLSQEECDLHVKNCEKCVKKH